MDGDHRVVMTKEAVLFEGRLGTQWVRVWLQRRAYGGIALLSHDIGPGLEHAFGTDELETFLEIDAADVRALAAALSAEGKVTHATRDPLAALVDRYRGDSAATTHLRELLATHGVPHRFSVV